ncbi:D-alanyl-D-alanine carboxypeptidase family protein [Planomicrobium sp. CPCC 101110]|uniref:M15 family metallopeptidase n=1 Tax=Planomicrobium sp. CPCC 101110 TaxID=2599619 RepID=UPI0011B79737|nr:M15 family metallopeptidase [Planomicrobium sp. CPCC 101110]TWT24634.1 M15 family metallopeptidase [Planomicrobium sp. CPCC 101110]
MPSRYTPNQQKKNPFIKWSLIIGSILVAAAAAAWFYLQSIDSPANIDDAATNEVQTSQSPGEEPPEGDGAVKEKAQELETAEAPEQEEEEKQEEPQEEPKETETKEKAADEAEPTKDATVYSDTVELPEEPAVINGILLANKQHPLPETYAPGEGKEARAAFEEMREKALQEGVDLVAFSTYRDYNRQKELYNGYVAKDGQEAADRYSARPGYSEHQTGLAFDIGEAGQEQHWASASFGDTKGGKWLAKNAHKYGFILRYPEGSESITGYMHESWHFRYVGKKAATEIHSKGITLEQYLGV